jgi:hypothetical protein
MKTLQRSLMAVPVSSAHRHRFSLPEEPPRRVAVWSLLMVAATAVAGLIAGVAGTFLQFVVFDLEEQQLLSEAGAWGHIAAFFLLALMVVPASNALVASYLVVTAIAFLVG